MSEAGDRDDWSGNLAITGLGLVTPVGLRADATLAALRAGVSRLSRIEHFEIEVDDGVFEAVIGAEVPGLTRGRLGPARLAALLAPAFQEALQDCQAQPEDRLGVFLGTSGSSPAERVLNYDLAARDYLLDAVPDGFRIERAKLIQAGRASVLKAIRAAAAALEAGLVDIALLGAVDSWVTPRALTWLRANQRLAEYPRRTGAMPGEAAGFLALETPARAQQRGAKVYASLAASAGRQETVKWGEATNAIALTQAVQSVVGEVQDERAVVMSDQSGERYRALEWVMASPKAMWFHRELLHLAPADCIGDAGAAMGPVLLAWAASALDKGYLGAQHILVWGASDEGAREAAMLQVAGGSA